MILNKKSKLIASLIILLCIISSIYHFPTFLINYKNLKHVIIIFLTIIPLYTILFYLTLKCIIYCLLKYELKMSYRIVNYNVLKEKYIATIADLCFILFSGILLFFPLIDRYPIPVGYDTPAYIGLVKIIELGMHRLDIFSILRGELYGYLLYYICKVVGINIENLAKYLVLESIVIAFSYYYLTKSITRNRYLGILAALLSYYWPRIHRLVWDLHRNALALIILNLYLKKLHDYYKDIQANDVKNIAMVIILLCLITIFHTLTAVVAIQTFISVIILKTIINSKSRIRKIIIACILSAIFFAVFLVKDDFINLSLIHI